MSKNYQEKKKMVVKIGAGGGVGVGAVILLGGAFATALASALIVGRKGRDRQNPPPPPKLQNELDEANYKSSNEAAMIEVESDNALLVSAPSLKMAEKWIEINGETAAGDASDVQESAKILDSVDPIKQENEYFPDGSVVIDKSFHLLEDHKFPPEPENMMVDMKILTTENGMSEIFEEAEDFKQVEFDNDRTDGEQNGDGEIKEMNPEETVEIAEMSTMTKESIEVRCDQEEISSLTAVHKALDELHIDEMEADNNPEMKVNFDQELYGSNCDNGETGEVKYEAVEENKLDLVADIEADQDEAEATVTEDFPPMIDSPVTERENIDDVEKSGVVLTEIVELSGVVISSNEENEINEEGQEDQIKLVEEEMFKEQKDFDQPDEEIVPEKCKEVGLIGVAYLIFPQTDIQNEVNEEEYISENKEHDEVGLEVNNGDASLESVIYQQKHCDDDDDEEEENIMEYEEEADEMDISEEVEESSIGTRDSSTKSNPEAVWPAEEPALVTQQVKLIAQEADRKTSEDKKVQVENGSNGNQIIHKSFTESNFHETTENSIKKYFVELKDRPGNATMWRILIVTLSLVSSYLCSWLFDCSFVKLSLIMLLSMVLSKIHGY